MDRFLSIAWDNLKVSQMKSVHFNIKQIQISTGVFFNIVN